MNKTILVTGANGQLGQCLRDVIITSSDRYLFTDVSELDITDLGAIQDWMRREAVDYVVNCAAYTAVDQAEDDVDRCFLINEQAVAYLAQACLAQRAKLIHVSTDYVFDGRRPIPYTEDQFTAPLGVYGSSKLAGEQAILSSGCEAVIVRTSWLYSPYGTNFVKTMQRLTAESNSLQVVFDQVGTPTSALDLALAIRTILEASDFRSGVYHYSNEGVCSWYDFALDVARLSGNNCDITPCHTVDFPTKVARPAYSVLDKTKIKLTYGLKIPHWKTSLAHMILQ